MLECRESFFHDSHSQRENDIKFRISPLFNSQTSNYPRIPQINSDFHVKMEVRDRIPGVYESPIYDMNLHYEYSLKLSRYTFATNGKMTIHS